MIAKLFSMVSPSRLRWVCLCLGLLDAAAGLAQAAGGLLPDVRGAERELARARHELEEIAGDQGEEAPALPVLPRRLLGLTARLDAVARLTAVARVAVGLRLEALEMGGYPSTPEELPAILAARLDEIEGLEYEWLDGRVRLRLPSKEVLSQWPEARRAWLEPLFLWELPELAAGVEDRGSDGAAAGIGPAAARVLSPQGTS